MDGFGFDQVLVIKDEHNPVGDRGNLVDQGGQDGLGRRRLRGLECAQRSFPDDANRALLGCRFLSALNGLQGRDEVGQNTDGVIIAFV